MADTTISPNMGLIVPTQGVDPGPDWANNIVADLGILDQHTHVPGQGLPVTPGGININTDLSFLSNNAVALRSGRFTSQSAVLSTPLDINCVYVFNGNLYYNDASGNQIALTFNGGTVVAPGVQQTVFVSAGTVVNSGSAETTLFSFTLTSFPYPSNVTLDIDWAVSQAANTNSKTIKVYFGSTIVANYVTASSSQVALVGKVIVEATGLSTQTSYSSAMDSTAVLGAQITTSSESAPVLVKITAQGTSTSDVTGRLLRLTQQVGG